MTEDNSIVITYAPQNLQYSVKTFLSSSLAHARPDPHLALPPATTKYALTIKQYVVVQPINELITEGTRIQPKPTKITLMHMHFF